MKTMNQEEAEMIKDSLRHQVSMSPTVTAALELIAQLEARVQQLEAPIEMLLFCPKCGMQHVDRAVSHLRHCKIGQLIPRKAAALPISTRICPECSVWLNPPHATHICQHCSLEWRPSNHLTTGVRAIDLLEEKHFAKIQACYPRYADLKFATLLQVDDVWDLNGKWLDLPNNSRGKVILRVLL